MESKIIELIGIAVKFILKCWSKDAFSASENMVDFAIHSKLSLIEARKFRTVFEKPKLEIIMR